MQGDWWGELLVIYRRPKNQPITYLRVSLEIKRICFFIFVYFASEYFKFGLFKKNIFHGKI